MYTLTYFKEIKARSWNLAMAWIDSKKTLVMISQEWITACLKMSNISEKVMQFITRTIENWIVELPVREQTIAKLKSKEVYSKDIHCHHNYLS